MKKAKHFAKELVEVSIKTHPDAMLVFTDGGCDKEGLGAWAYHVWDPVSLNTDSRSAAVSCTTNNRMEMRAVIEALSVVEIGRPIIVHSDSKYVIGGVTEWVDKWKAQGWLKADGSPVKNKDLWLRLRMLRDLHVVSFKYVPGHKGVHGNEVCDKLCSQAIKTARYTEMYGGDKAPLDEGLLP